MNKLLHIPPPVYALLSLGVCKGIDSLLPMGGPTFPLLGAALALAGLGLMLWAWLHFLKQKTTPIPTGEPSALVTDGPYRFSRNPMYLGIVIVLTSVAFFVGSPLYLLSPVGFFWVVDRLFIPYEEAKLERLFAGGYADLRARVPRWLWAGRA
ncbi:MAG: methyltransferase family protein [Candidatus Methylumidiphilus sp.]